MVMSGPDLPVFELQAGAWRAQVFDPRPDPLALGARYVHGGYVAALWHGDRQLTGRASPAWDPYVGQGLPDVFELPFARDSAKTGEPYLRIGAGRLIRGVQEQVKGPPAAPIAWELLSHDANHVTQRCTDQIERNNTRYAYRLTRTIRLTPDGLDATTDLTLRLSWNAPIFWFTHPFFAQTQGDATGFIPPAPATLTGSPLTRDAAGALHLPAAGGLANAVGLWGATGPVRCLLDPRLGGGVMDVAVNRPMDHLVLYASPLAASCEPQLARAWKDHENAQWTVSYRFQPA